MQFEERQNRTDIPQNMSPIGVVNADVSPILAYPDLWREIAEMEARKDKKPRTCEIE